MNTKVHVLFLLNIWMKLKLNFVYKHEHKKIKFIFFSNNKLKFNLEPRT